MKTCVASDDSDSQLCSFMFFSGVLKIGEYSETDEENLGLLGEQVRYDCVLFQVCQVGCETEAGDAAKVRRKKDTHACADQ
jgi:hypothetical protein